MKRFGSLLILAVLAGALTLGTYKLFFEKPVTVVAASNQPNFVKTTTSFPINNNITATENVDFVAAAEATVNAVVHVKNVSIASAPVTIMDFFYGRTRPQARIGTGSGVIISPDGYIITNNHVIENASEIEITTNDNKTFKASLVGTDPETDIALLKVDANEDFPYITFGDSDNTKIGEWVLAVGNPFNLTSTVTAGIVSAKSRDLNPNDRINQSFIQTDAAVNPGNSGGALVNVRGELIGINTAITSQTGSYIGYSFAVPSNIARKVVEDIMEYGDVQEGMLGVSGNGLNSVVAEALKIKETQGFYIGAVEENSGAEKAGLKEGDIIKKIDNVTINKFSDMAGYLKSKRPNDVVQVTILRNGKYKTVPVTLSKKVLTFTSLYGLQLKNLTNADKAKYKIKEGVKVTGNRNPQFSRMGITEGYLVIQINDYKITNINDVEAFLQTKENMYKLIVVSPSGEIERYIFQ